VESLLKATTYLCALTAFGAVLQYLEPVYVAGFAVLASLAALTEFKILAPYPRWSLNLSSVLVLFPSLLRIGPDFLVSPVLEGLVLLMAIKLLEDKKSRDYMQVCLIAVFLLIGSTLMSFSIAFLFYFSLILLLSTLSLMLLACFSHHPKQLWNKGPLLRLFLQALLICTFSLPVCALLFIVLPRANIPILGLVNKTMAARTGFSDSVSLGDISDIQEDPSVVFRAAMDEVGSPELYWRGVVLDQFDGSSWKKNTREDQENTPSLKLGRETEQTIYLEPFGSRYFFALDRPVGIYPEKARRWRKPANIRNETFNQRIRYRAVSVATDFIPAANVDYDRYVQLPSGFSPRISELAKRVIQSGGTADPVRSLMKFLRSGEYGYSMKGLPSSVSPLEDFLFDRKHGNCEYFASALAVMLRSAGIPARIVGGYRGGYYNPTGKYYLVLQKNAHVWVEAYDSGGWERFDPTPPGISSPEYYQSGLLLKLRLMFDTFNFYWERFVIDYDLSDQFALWGKVRSGIKNPGMEFGWRGIGVRNLAEAVPVIVIIPLIYILTRRLRKRPEQELIALFLRRMVKRGYRKGSSEGLEEFVDRVGEPELKSKAEEFVAGFQGIFYRDQKFFAEDVKHLKSRIRQM
jgi:transglutaminase-like putative cysteine protease